MSFTRCPGSLQVQRAFGAPGCQGHQKQDVGGELSVARFQVCQFGAISTSGTSSTSSTRFIKAYERANWGGGKNRLRGRTDPEQGQGQQSGRSPSGIGVFEGLCLGAQALCKFNGLSVPLVARGTESLSCYEV